MPRTFSAEIVTAAIAGFEQQKLHIDSQIAELRAMLPGRTVKTTDTADAAPRKRRKMSAAGRKAIAEAQRKRWAQVKRESTPEPVKLRRSLSRSAKAKLVENLKKARAAKAAKADSVKAKQSTPARKKAAVKKAALKTPSPKAAKKAAVVKKAVAKKTPPAVATAATEPAGQ